MSVEKDNQSTVECPECGADFNVNELLYHQVKEQALSELKGRTKETEKALRAKEQALKEEKAAILLEKEELEERVKNELKSKSVSLKAELKKELEEENSDRLTGLEDELKEKSEKLKEFNKAKSDIARLEREKDEIESNVQAAAEVEMNKQLKAAQIKWKEQNETQNEMQLREKDELINAMKEQLKVAQRKAEQGSMQAQGEVQELAIEDFLNKEFPMDTISEVKKGARGADCMQIINTRESVDCGKIYYESKRTKAFQASWITKFKEDMRVAGADIGVLITETMPTDDSSMHMREGIWICTYLEFKLICPVLRDSLIRISRVALNEENKGDKMAVLYDFMMGREFRSHIEALVENMTIMQADLEKEKRAIQGNWKKRQTQIERIFLGTSEIYGSVRAIAGKAFTSIDSLELGSEEVEELPEASVTEE